MLKFSTGLKFAAIASVVLIAGCTTKPQATAEAPPPVASTGPMTTETQSSVVAGSEQDLKVNVGDTVHFGYNEYSVQDEDKTTLQRQAAWLQKFPAVRVTVEGALRRTRHARIQSRSGRSPRQCGEGISRQPRRVLGARGYDLLRQGASHLLGIRRVLLGAEPPRRDGRGRRRVLLIADLNLQERAPAGRPFRWGLIFG